MRNLEEDIERLVELDEWRSKAERMRDDGRRVIAASYDAEPLLKAKERRTKSRARIPALPRDEITDGLWKPAKTPLLEYSYVLKAILARNKAERIALPAGLLDKLENIPLTEVMEPEPDGVPILRAAKVLCALSSAPNSAFSSSVMYLYYYLIRAMYTAEAPEWSTGGARAGDPMAPNAYVTWQCIRAVTGLCRAIDQTATLFGAIASIIEEADSHTTVDLPQEWKAVEARRLSLEFSTTLEILRDNIAIKLPIPEKIDVGAIDKMADALCVAVQGEIESRYEEFTKAARQLANRRKALQRRLEQLEKERQHHDTPKLRLATNTVKRRLLRSATAHNIALEAVRDAARRSELALEAFTEKNRATRMRRLQDAFREAARHAARVMAPAITYVSRALDRELAVAASPTSAFSWDPAEMAFAAVAWGEGTQRWDDDRLRRAAEHLSSIIGERGRFPLGRPIHASERGYQLHALNADVIRAFSMLLRHSRATDVSVEVVRRMMAYFQDTQSPSLRGLWKHEEMHGQGHRIVSSAAVLALEAITRMLDERINDIVFRHFSVKLPASSQISLSDLFYPDYGLVNEEGGDLHRRQSIGEILQRMRAHVAGVSLDTYDPLYSLVLHGPPGTGKTTIVEALAKSAGVPLVEVTPSDIVIGGADAIERRARAVFKALSLLSRTVILFDEFDPVLLKRMVDDRQPSVFSFLTPGMLPKLKTLHENAERQCLAYVLITNLVGKLDQAAIRNGRFDERVGIYPPDLLARTGQLCKTVAQYCSRAKENGRETAEPSRELVWEVVRRTAGLPMSTIGKKGWFTAPDEVSEEERHIFTFLFDDRHPAPEYPAPEARLELQTPEEGVAAAEYRQWMWVRLWDAAASECGNLAEAMACKPDPAAVDGAWKRAADEANRF